MALRTPDSDQRAFRDTSPGLRLALLCIFSIALMALDNQNQHLVGVRRILSATIYPIRALIDAPSSFGHWIGDTLATRDTLIAENDDLQRKILIQNGRLQRMGALQEENSRLRALLDSTAKVGDRVLIAEIMSVDMNPFRHLIVVNRGSLDGVQVGQALIDSQGIIGQVIRDQVFSAEAILITDVDHALPVEVLRNRLRTIAVGTGDLERLSLPFLPRNADVVTGDVLVTSGLGGTFPPGYPVGVVSTVTSEVGEPFLKISAEPAAALNRVREVLLIWPEPQESLPDEGEREPLEADSTVEAPIEERPAPADETGIQSEDESSGTAEATAEPTQEAGGE
jgi:rod shape-determining protein MreC